MEIPMMSDKEYDELARTLATQGSLALHEHHPDLESLRVGLSWEPTALDHELDLDLAAVLLTESGTVRGAGDLVFYNQPRSPCGQVTHLHRGAAQAHAADKPDQEVLLINLAQIPDDVHKIAIIVSVYQGAQRGQNFGLTRAARVNLYNEGKAGKPIAHLDLTEDLSTATAAVVGELQRGRDNKHARDWHYVATGLGDENGLESLLLDYGLGAA